MKQHYKIRIEGRVQGVWFRASTRDEARRLGLKGFVRNELDGSVYVEVEGEEDKLEEFMKWCYIGSQQSEVKKVTTVKGDLQEFAQFDVR